MAIILTKVSEEMFEEAIRICKSKPRVYQTLDPITSPFCKCIHDVIKWYNTLHETDKKRFVALGEVEVFAHDLAKRDGTTVNGSWADKGEIIGSTSITSYLFSKKRWITNTSKDESN